jgi:hypothetical protein
MEMLLLECAVRATLIAIATGFILSVMRIKNVAARHRAWTGVMLAMLMLPLWTAFGYQMPIRVLSPIGQEPKVIRTLPPEPIPVVKTQARNLSSAVSKPDVRLQPVNWGQFIVGVYVLGFFLFLLRLAIGTVGVHLLIRRARREHGRLTSSSCVSPITVGFLRAVTILPDAWTRWSQAKLDAVLVHENEHARRRDPLWQGLALLNRAIFWFHPLAWWLERKLAALSEEACDSAVLEHGHAQKDYSEYLLELADAVMIARKRLRFLGMAMPGYLLPQRIEKIMRGSQVVGMSRLRIALTILVCLVFSVAFATGTLAHARLAPANRMRQISPPSVGTDTRAPRLAALKATVTGVFIRGNRRIPTATIRSELQTKAGDPVSLNAISRDIGVLYSLGFFDDVHFETDSAGSGTIIVFSVKERPLIRAIQYKGPQSVTIPEIQQALRNAHTGIAPDAPYSLSEATAAAEVLKSMLVAKGYAQATVGIATEPVRPNSVNVVFVVDEGSPVIIDRDTVLH